MNADESKRKHLESAREGLAAMVRGIAITSSADARSQVTLVVEVFEAYEREFGHGQAKAAFGAIVDELIGKLEPARDEFQIVRLQALSSQALT